DNGAGSVQVVANGAILNYAGVSQIDIRDTGGNNHVNYTATSGLVVNALYYNWEGQASLPSFGKGVDVFNAFLSAGLSKDMVIRAAGGDGNDTLQVVLAGTLSAGHNLGIDMEGGLSSGQGNEIVSVDAWSYAPTIEQGATLWANLS